MIHLMDRIWKKHETNIALNFFQDLKKKHEQPGHNKYHNFLVPHLHGTLITRHKINLQTVTSIWPTAFRNWFVAILGLGPERVNSVNGGQLYIRPWAGASEFSPSETDLLLY